MVEIRTLADILGLEAEKEISKEFSDHLKVYFEELRLALDEEIPINLFSLARHGYIVILGDVADWKMIPELDLVEVEDIFELIPEFTKKIALANGETYFQTGILCGNDYMLIVYFKEGLHKKIEDFLMQYEVN